MLSYYWSIRVKYINNVKNIYINFYELNSYIDNLKSSYHIMTHRKKIIKKITIFKYIDVRF